MRKMSWSPIVRVMLGVGLLATSTHGQEAAPAQPSGLALAAAMEQSLQLAIARSEKSVVAIARVKRNHSTADNQAIDVRPNPFGLANVLSTNSDPTDPDFVPSEFGAGVVIDRAGLILTTCDVLGDLEDYQVSEFYVTAADRKVRSATLKAADPRSNLAVLDVKSRDLTPIELGDGSQLRKGQIVLALGNPYAIARDGQASASWGIVSNLQRKAGRAPDDSNQSGKSTLHHLGTLIQTDAKLNFGASGGALLNLHGEMVGLTTSLAAAAGYEQAAGYAIPVDETFRRILDDLRNGKGVQYGFLGVQPDLNIVARQMGEQGVLVRDVVRGTPAERSGIRPGDLITHVNGKAVHDFDALVLHVGSQRAGQQVLLAVERGGQQIPVPTTLAKYRVYGQPVVTQPEPAWRGLRVDYWTAVVDFWLDREQLQAIDEEGCVVITEVEQDSPAAKAGCKPNVAITHVDGARVSTPQEFMAAVASLTGPVTLRIAGSPADAATDWVVAE